MGHLNASGPGHVGTRGDSGQGWRGDCAYEDVGIVGILVKEWGVGRGDFEKYDYVQDFLQYLCCRCFKMGASKAH